MHSKVKDKQHSLRDKLIGLGEHSMRKNYYAELQQSLDQLHASEELNQAILRSLYSPIAVLDNSGNIITVNDAFIKFVYELSGKKQDFINNINVIEICQQSVFQAAHWKKIVVGLKKVLLGLKENFSMEFNQQLKDGKHWFLLQAVPLKSKQGGVVIALIDITEHKKIEEKIEFLAYHDSLTNLPNRILFKKQLSAALKKAKQKQKNTAVLFLDLDRFKFINDSLGHNIGDFLLKSAANRLVSCLRKDDVISRMGGDEFIVLLSEIDSEEDAVQISKKIITAMQKPFNINGLNLHVSTSIGIAIYPKDGRDEETLLKNADTAMYHAKEKGRNNYQLYNQSMYNQAIKLLKMENSLRKALELNEFTLHYQPKVNVNSKKVIGVEALIRWQHPKHGIISPAEFIPLAEEIGLIIPIGEWVLRTACNQNIAWQQSGLPPIRMAVNLSAKQFLQTDFKKIIADILQETGLEAQWLELEITENIAMHNIKLVSKILQELKSMGIHISLDDFGTGYSSLSFLKKMPIDMLKIDRSFITDITSDADNAAIVAAAIAMAHSLKLKVVAEGVETAEQLQFLKKLKCNEVQGFLFSEPVTQEKIAKMLKLKQFNIDPAPTSL